ncbi:MAG: glycosyltransferase family 4 protein [Chloroflexi bacterium]|nr:glycosyltransferase family 4 protein [Chloroflexota bacterium]
MRICFIQSQGHMYSGGQGVYLHYVTRELARMGHEVHVIAGVPYPDVSPEVHIHKVKTFSFWSYLDNFAEYAYRTHPLLFFHPVNLFEFATTRYTLSSLLNIFSLRAYHKLNELEREVPFDLIHDNQTLGYGIWLMKMRGRPVLANIHHPLSIDRQNALAQAKNLGDRISNIFWYPWVMQHWVAARLDRIITGSAASAASVAEAFDLPQERIRVIHDGVETELFRPLEDVTPEPNSLLFVGNSEDRNKGIRYLLEALASLRGQASCHLTVVHRPRSHEAPRLARQLGLQGQVTFLEALSREELVRQYNSAQLLVCPSRYEGFGLPAAEAMACGTPVVATTAGALPEIIEDGATGLLVPPADVESLAGAIRTLLEQPERCRSMGEAGVRRVRERFSWRRTAEETVALYEELLGRRAAAAPSLRVVSAG